jgi:hypothetical protein
VPGIHVFAPIYFLSVSFPFHHCIIALFERNSFRDDDHILVVLDEPHSRLLDPNVHRTWNRQS